MPQIHERQAVTMLLSGATGERELRFPLVIERDEVPIDMDGRGQMFTVYAYEDHAHAVARIDGLQLIVRCSRSLLQDGLELRRLQTKELVEMAPQGFLENNPIRRLKRRWRR